MAIIEKKHFKLEFCVKIDKKEMIIRYANNNDYLWLFEHDNHISETILKNKINNKEIYVVEKNEKIIGWLRYNLFWDNTPFMNMIYVLEEYQKMGIGKILVKYWEDEMKQNGYNNVLTSTQYNEEAQHFYSKIGYKEIGKFKYLNDPYEILFQKIL
jgi:ribosomal protein S18 acetylase RimI-like enzyme